jgi:hypothetical protein
LPHRLFSTPDSIARAVFLVFFPSQIPANRQRLIHFYTDWERYFFSQKLPKKAKCQFCASSLFPQNSAIGSQLLFSSFCGQE